MFRGTLNSGFFNEQPVMFLFGFLVAKNADKMYIHRDNHITLQVRYENCGDK